MLLDTMKRFKKSNKSTVCPDEKSTVVPSSSSSRLQHAGQASSLTQCGRRGSSHNTYYHNNNNKAAPKESASKITLRASNVNTTTLHQTTLPMFGVKKAAAGAKKPHGVNINNNNNKSTKKNGARSSGKSSTGVESMEHKAVASCASTSLRYCFSSSCRDLVAPDDQYHKAGSSKCTTTAGKLDTSTSAAAFGVADLQIINNNSSNNDVWPLFAVAQEYANFTRHASFVNKNNSQHVQPSDNKHNNPSTNSRSVGSKDGDRNIDDSDDDNVADGVTTTGFEGHVTGKFRSLDSTTNIMQTDDNPISVPRAAAGWPPPDNTLTTAPDCRGQSFEPMFYDRSLFTGNSTTSGRPTFGVLQPSVSQAAVPKTTTSCSCCTNKRPTGGLGVQVHSLTRLSHPENIGSLKYRNGRTPIPRLMWADENSVWNLMCWKDTVYHRHAYYLTQHPGITTRMRAILIDWLNEVCQEYKLHRETFYLAVDFIDRYLSKEHNVSKDHLQLVGVTALFIASKLEEIYPPKCCQFAEMTAGACSAEHIEKLELVMLHTLNWALCPVTPIHWSTLYLQIIENSKSVNELNAAQTCTDNCPDARRPPNCRSTGDPDRPVECPSSDFDCSSFMDQCSSSSSCSIVKAEPPAHLCSTPQPPLPVGHRRRSFRKRSNNGNAVDCGSNATTSEHGPKRSSADRDFLFSKFQRYHFLHLAQLVDLAILDIGSLKFPYSVIAACAFAHIVEPENLALSASGFKTEDLTMCYQWMIPFARCVQEMGDVQVKYFPDVPEDDAHNIQVHSVDLACWERAQALQHEMLCNSRLTPPVSLTSDNCNSSNNNNTNTMNKSLSNIYPTPPPSDERPMASLHHHNNPCNNNNNTAPHLHQPKFFNVDCHFFPSSTAGGISL